MKLNAYVVYDAKTLVYGVPFFAPTDGSAIRSMQELSNDLNTTVGRHPTDFSLWCVGSYEDQNGQLVSVTPLRHVVDANALLQRQEPLFPDVEATFDHKVERPNGQAR